MTSKLQNQAVRGPGPDRPVSDVGLGVLHIDSCFPLVPGHLQNAGSMGIPLVYECVEGIEPAQIVACDPGVKAPLVAAAKRLQGRGVRAIIGTCGSFVNYHAALLNAVDIPVFSSVLSVLPQLLASLHKDAKVGVIFASVESFTPQVQKAIGLTDMSRLVVADCMSLPAFRPIMANENWLDSDALEQELLAHIQKILMENKDVAMLMLQCSELAPYAVSIRQSASLPVFDINGLARWVAIALGIAPS